MSLKVQKVGADRYHAKSYNPSGVLEWESKKAQSFEELTGILVSDLKYHQLDILDAFQEADPERFVTSDGLRSAAESASQTKSTDESIEKAKGLIDGWLKNIKKGS